MAPSDDLTDLVERLRGAGFRVDTRQYLIAHELLLAYAARGRPLEDSHALASHLGPIFCTMPEEQRRFAAEVAAWRGEGAQPSAPAELRSAPSFDFWRRWRLPLLAAAAAVAIAVGAGVLVYREYRPIAIEGVVTIDAGTGTPVPAPNARVVFREAMQAVDAQGRFRLTTRRVDGDGSLQVESDAHTPVVRNVDADTPSPIRVRLRPRPRDAAPAPASTVAFGDRVEMAVGAAPRYTTSEGTRLATIVGSGVTGAFMLLALLLGDWGKRRLALKRLRALGDPEELTLSPTAPEVVRTADHELRRIGSALRKPQEQATVDLDACASVAATLRAGGLFAPVYAARRAMPEYLVLVQRRSADDHWTAWVTAWIEQLTANGVHAERLTFGDDPRVCYADDATRQPHRLVDLVAHHHRATLFVFAESEVCFDPLGGGLHRWVDTVHALPRRVLFTPEPPFRWTRREWLLSAEGFVVLPAGEEGLRAFAGLAGEWRIERMFPASYARAYPAILAGESHRWIDRNAPPAASVATLLRQLRGYLGPEGLALLCACAVYPQLSWPLTARLASLPALGVAVGSSLPALARLPWMRHGFMPDWLRVELLAALTPAQDTALRNALETMLAELALADRARADGGEAPTPSVDAQIRLSRWVGPLDLLRAAPPGSALRDRVFVGFIAGETRDRLLLRVGPALLERFRGRHVGELPEAGERANDRGPAPASAQPVRVFVSYRRSDSGPYAGRLIDNLRARAPVFDVREDMRTITAGEAWSDAVARAIASVDVVLVVIGPEWLLPLRYKRATSESPGAAPLDDFVSEEVGTALAQGKRVVPILVGGAPMPREDELHPELAPLARRQAIALTDERWSDDVETLVRAIAPRGPAASVAPRLSGEAAQRSAAEGRALARALLARVRAWCALHPGKTAGIAALAAGAFAFAILHGLLPDARGDVAAAAPFVAFSPDGRWIVTRSQHGSTALVDVASRTIRDLRDHGARATSASFSRGGEALAVGYDDGTVRRIDVAAARAEPGPWLRASGSILDVAYATNGGVLAIGRASIATLGPAAQRPDERPLPARFAGNLAGASIAPGAERYALLATSGDVEVVYADGRPSRSLQCGTSAVPALGPGSNQIACAGFASGALRLPGSGRGDLVSPLHPAAFEIASIAYSRDGRLVASGGSDGLVDVWDIATGRPAHVEPLRAFDAPVQALAFDASGDRLAAYGQGRVVVWPVVRRSPAEDTKAAEPQTQAAAERPGRRVAMPSLVGMTVPTARVALERQSFVLQPVVERASSAPRGTIIEQSPAARSPVAQGANVSVVVSDGSLVRVPQLVGLDLQGARKALAETALRSVERGVLSNASNQRVVAQQPSAGVDVARGSAVTISIAPRGDAVQSTLPTGGVGAPQDAKPGEARDTPAQNPALQRPLPNVQQRQQLP